MHFGYELRHHLRFQDKEVDRRDDSTSLALRWTVPEDSGGAEIIDYEAKEI
jgi:hypothetical protein